jgi:hypothetical protein
MTWADERHSRADDETVSDETVSMKPFQIDAHGD